MAIFPAAGRMTNRSFQRSDGESGHERYAYDRLGRLETAVYTNVDFWLNGTIAFGHDGRGFLASGKFTDENGFDAEIQFETDADGNVLKMRWAFGFGKTQTYTFQYEPISR